jgi:hypothetical protein
MNRLSNWPLFASVVVAATALAAGCTPSNNPPPGPPVLTEAFIIENGASATLITPSSAPCAVSTKEGAGCDPSTDAVCQDVPNATWCRCQMNAMAFHPPAHASPDDGSVDADVDGGTDGAADDGGASSDGPPPPPPGVWSCTFALNSGVLYVFDRLLDTAPLGDGSGGVTGVADGSSVPAPVNKLAAGADYGSNGNPGSILFPLLGTFRADGPSLFVTGQPDPAGRAPIWSPWTGALAANAQVTFTLSKTAVLAKDGVSAFTSTGPLVDGSISFATSSFSANLTVPTPAPPADPDAGPGPDTVPPDMTPVVLTFTGPVDAATIKMHVTITAVPAVPVDFDVQAVDGLTVNIVPVDTSMTPPAPTTWPASSKITVTIDGTAPSVAGDTLGSPVTDTFTTSAM